ncbi:hypothetical protein [Desulfopila aestuarii]|uniref:Uncharacterized protein n=1 Tax=Desulfopila aestuarii DSM 18488 TaxID=1121416 RepID=A0A1M7YCW5_9BACT|nr:hypothetical protein [Desulfopila aestuarii]SHO50453.1 hypothetical protein SAMN02745220_03459 [Desulfopila aestuarii DSM 18488]
MMTVRTADTGESFMQITALQVLVGHVRDDRTVKNVSSRKALGIAGFKLGKVYIQQLPEWRFLRISRMVDFSLAVDSQCGT